MIDNEDRKKLVDAGFSFDPIIAWFIDINECKAKSSYENYFAWYNPISLMCHDYFQADLEKEDINIIPNDRDIYRLIPCSSDFPKLCTEFIFYFDGFVYRMEICDYISVDAFLKDIREEHEK